MLFLRRSFITVEDDFKPFATSAIKELFKPDRRDKSFKSDRHDKIFDVIKLIRSECHFEMNQIGTRLTWMLAAQTFLVSSSAVAISNALSQNTRGAGWLAIFACAVSLVGMTISLRSYLILHAAIWTLDLWHSRIREIIAESMETGKNSAPQGNSDEFRMDYHAFVLGRWLVKDDPVHHASLTFAKLIPGVFFVFWLILLVAAARLGYLLPLNLALPIR